MNFTETHLVIFFLRLDKIKIKSFRCFFILYGVKLTVNIVNIVTILNLVAFSLLLLIAFTSSSLAGFASVLSLVRSLGLDICFSSVHYPQTVFSISKFCQFQCPPKTKFSVDVQVWQIKTVFKMSMPLPGIGTFTIFSVPVPIQFFEENKNRYQLRFLKIQNKGSGSGHTGI